LCAVFATNLLKRTDMPDLSPWHLLILAAVFVLLFGSRKLPDAARSLGKSMRIFKAETKALRDGEDADDVRSAQAVQPQAAHPQPVQSPVQPVQSQPVQSQPMQSQPMQSQPMQSQPMRQQAPAQQVSVTLDDGTIVSGVPLAEAQRNQQSP
jgi:sec-independent protein translocase protein TatA